MEKVVVITGVSRGLGLEMCKQYLASGAKVYGCSRSPERSQGLLELKRAFGSQFELVPLDITQPGMIQNLKYVIEEPVDILINNAGIYGPAGLSWDQVTSDPWMEVMQVDVVAQLMVVQALVEKVAASGDKKILFMSSKMGSMGDNQKGGSYIYRSAKAALNAVGKSLAIDLKAQGISVGLLHPGWVLTDMGGPNALITADTSVSGMRKVIDNLSLKNSGQFFSYDGSVIPW
ncbi:SDR family oxidoreductase [uncultured Endozoicomonas sp.]|uniref:SDR family oxidoreductase n=1 Tax=uncultured Endozoicomonas sp. TaxID=432652 RepID=UPI0026219892|nr:SDR family oxidoreductase [uncultured Endozoicomonas sp.]